jgi:hypothetical protein
MGKMNFENTKSIRKDISILPVKKVPSTSNAIKLYKRTLMMAIRKSRFSLLMRKKNIYIELNK